VLRSGNSCNTIILVIAGVLTLHSSASAQQQLSKQDSVRKTSMPGTVSQKRIEHHNPLDSLDYWRRVRATLEVLSQRNSKKDALTIPNAKPESSGQPIDRMGIATVDTSSGISKRSVANPDFPPKQPTYYVVADSALLQAYYKIARLSSDSIEITFVEARLKSAALDLNSSHRCLAQKYLDSLRVKWDRR
jgi:hypothetical protein